MALSLQDWGFEAGLDVNTIFAAVMQEPGGKPVFWGVGENNGAAVEDARGWWATGDDDMPFPADRVRVIEIPRAKWTGGIRFGQSAASFVG